MSALSLDGTDECLTFLSNKLHSVCMKLIDKEEALDSKRAHQWAAKLKIVPYVTTHADYKFSICGLDNINPKVVARAIERCTGMRTNVEPINGLLVIMSRTEHVPIKSTFSVKTGCIYAAIIGTGIAATITGVCLYKRSDFFHILSLFVK
jgi:hypothetical protein